MAACRSALTSGGIELPGCNRLTTTKPIVMEKIVVSMYMPMVLPPIRDSLLTSDKEATPVTKDAKTSGMAISFNRLTNKVPNGVIQSWVNPLR